MKYYAYTRVSTETQAKDGYGLDTQKAAIEKYMQDNAIEIAGFYSDEGISGTIYDRPGLSDMLSVLEKGDKIIVWETSRLWREDFVRCTLIHTLKKLECDIISVSQPSFSLYTESASDWLLNSILAVLDEYDKILIVRKLQAGRKTKAKSGSKACGAAPIGYRWAKDATIEPDPLTAPVVAEIFKTYEECKSLSKLAEICRERGFKTSRGKDFSRQSLRAILDNSFYIGRVKHIEEYAGTHAAIIPQELFDSVQNILHR